MKRLSDQGLKPTLRGYLAACSRCGLVVVHAESTMMPFHMHRYSRLCRDLTVENELAADARAKAILEHPKGGGLLGATARGLVANHAEAEARKKHRRKKHRRKK